eukprot:489132_1
MNEPPTKKRKLLTNHNNNNDIKMSFNIDWFGGSDKGKKAHMEDRRIGISDLSLEFKHPFTASNKCRLFAIIDGHGGSSVSSYIQSHLASIFIDHLKKYVIDKPKNDKNDQNDTKEKEKDIQRALHATFKNCDLKILKWITPMKTEG